MAIYNKFQQFVKDIGSKVHDFRSACDTLKVYLTNNAPDAAAHAVKADLEGITEENGYAETDIQNDYVVTDGIAFLTGVDITFIASGGNFGPFRYAVIYNDTPESPKDPLIAWWDYGSILTVVDGDSFDVLFGDSIFTLA